MYIVDKQNKHRLVLSAYDVNFVIKMYYYIILSVDT